MNAASTTPLILGILQKGESYGYEIVESVKAVSDQQIEWPEGVLYPVLHRLEKKGLVSSSWRESPEGRKRKYYSITVSGKEALAAERRQWSIVVSVLDSLWEPIPRLAGATP